MAGQLSAAIGLLFTGRSFRFILTRASWMGTGQRKEQMDGISSIERTEFVHDEPSESHCLVASQPESHGNHHFKAVHVIANPVVLPDMSHRFLFRQFIVFVNGSNSLTNIATEHIERIGHLLLRHPNGSGRHRDRPVFSDCDYSSFHVRIIFHCLNSVYIPFSSRCNCRI